MKKYLIGFLFSILFLMSCQDTDFKSTAIENPKKETTVNMLSTMDTMIVKIDTENHVIYQMQDSLVVREFKWYNNDDIATPVGLLFFLIMGLVLIIVGGWIFSD